MGVLYAKVAGSWQPILMGTGTYLPLTGGTLSGNLIFTPPAKLDFGNGGARQMIDLNTTAYGIGTQSAYEYFRTNTGAGFAWYQGGVHSNTSADPGAGGKTIMRTSASGTLTVGEAMTSLTPVCLVGPLDSCYMPFYCEGDMAVTRSGYIGFPTSTTMRMKNERPGGALALDTPGFIVFITASSEAARLDTSGNMFFGKTGTSPTTQGVEILNTGRIYATVTNAAQYCVISTIINGANANVFHDFRGGATGSTRIGWIIVNATANGVLYATASDYRLKNVLGPVADPIERVKRLRPVHFSWKNNDEEEDGFLAHEVADIVPEAVNGEKDEVDDEGEIAPQGMDNGKLIPLLVAAIQEQQKTIEALTARIEALEAA